MSPSDSCPEDSNATACLLRVLLNVVETQFNVDNSSYDWNPITFAFTAPVGILAVLIAFFPVYQAVLASGPGRRKSNRRAIGFWADKTRMEWSWQTLNFQSKAYTPLLRTKRILEIPQKLRQSQEPARHRMRYSAQLLRTVMRTVLQKCFQQQSDNAPSATWYRFLEHLGIHKLHLMHKLHLDDDLETTFADYLPDDIIAVPAYADVGFIVTMAAVTGAHSFQRDSQSPYPIMIGEDFQIDFRQHQTLGTIAAFSRYGESNQSQVPPDVQLRHIMLAIRHARGDVDVGPLSPISPLFKSADHTVLPENQIPLSINAIHQSEPTRVLQVLTSHDCRQRQHHYLCRNRNIYSTEDEHHLLWLLLAKPPNHLPAIFPSQNSRTPNVLTILALNSSLWSRPRDDDFNVHDFNLLYLSKSTTFGSLAELSDAQDLEYISQLVLPPGERDEQKIKNYPLRHKYQETSINEKGVSVMLQDVLQACFKLLHGFEDFETWFNGMYLLRKQCFRTLVLLQLQQVDNWLNDTDHVNCRIISLYHTTLGLLNVDKAVSEKRFPELLSGSRWQTLEVFMEWRSQNDIAVRHFEMLKSLATFIEHFRGSGARTDWYRVSQNQLPQCWDQFKCIFRNHHPPDDETRAQILRSIEDVLDSSYKILSAYPEVRLYRDRKTTAETSEEAYGRTASFSSGDGVDSRNNLFARIEGNEETESRRLVYEGIDNALVFRCLLVALLFWTAPDSSTILSSGLWEHVIPVI
jgi:hypothetical protein